MTVRPQVISGDTEWVGKTGRMDRPVRITTGGTLRLVDCHLELHQDDVPWFETPFFYVEDGGTLEIYDSVLEAVPSTIPDDALVGPHPNNSDIPYISRVINLEGTSEPVLTFDMKWRSWGTPVSVAVQRDPTSDLDVLETFDPQRPCEDWEHIEVPLGAYVEELARIIIYFPQYPEAVIFIKDLNVTDGGRGLPYNPPFPEDYYQPIWSYEAFYEYSTTLIRKWENRKAIHSEGTVVLKGSTVRVPTQLHRSGSPDFEREHIREVFLYKNVWSSMKGMNIHLEGGSLDANDTLFEAAAVIGIGSHVQLSDCRFESPYDMVSLYNSSGTISKSTFTRKGDLDGLAYFDKMDRPMWAISVQNNTNMGTVAIVECEFNDVEQGIDLSYASYRIEGCSFIGVENICLWEHSSPEPTDWEDLVSINTFQDCPGQLYIRTGRTDLFFMNESVSHRNDTFVDTQGIPIEQVAGYSYYRWSTWHRSQARLIRLDVLVESLDSTRVVNRTEVRVYAKTPSYNWYDTLVTVIVPIGVEAMDVDEHALVGKNVGKIWEDVQTSAGIYKVWQAGDAKVGTYNMTVIIEAEDLWVSNISVDVHLDGEAIRHVDEDEFWNELYYGSRARMEISQYLTPGIHDIRVVVAGLRFLNETIVNDTEEVFFNGTFKIMRATPSSTSEEIETFVRGENSTLAIDADTIFELDEFQPVNSTWYGGPRFFMTGGRGAGLTLSNLSFDNGSRIDVGLYSHLDIRFVDTAVPRCNFLLVNDHLTYNELLENDHQSILGEFTVQNCTGEGFMLDIGQYSINVTDSNGPVNIQLFASANTTVFMENVTNPILYSWAYGPIWSYTIKDCEFYGWNSSGLSLNTDLIKDISITNTTFNGATLGLEATSPLQGRMGLDISGCRFIGNNSLFYMLWNTYRRDDWGSHPSQYPIHDGTVSGNTFSGNGTTVVLHHALFNDTFIDNTLADGVKAWAWYWTEAIHEPDTGDNNDHEHHVFEDPRLRTEFPEPFRESLRDENYFYDVTDQMGGPIEHPRLKTAIFWNPYWGYGMLLSDIVYVDLARDWSTVIYQVWPDIQDLLPTVIDDWPWDLGD
jgi:hypothetical protein